jgi:hypothetical protein
MHFPPMRISDGARRPDSFLFLEHGLRSCFLKFGRPRFCIAPLAKWLQSTGLSFVLLHVSRVSSGLGEASFVIELIGQKAANHEAGM